MKMPKEIKIGGHVYKVIFEKDSIVDNNDNCGRTHRDKGIIGIGNSLIQSEKEVTFFHEVIHLINGELDEKEVDWIAQGIYAVTSPESRRGEDKIKTNQRRYFKESPAGRKRKNRPRRRPSQCQR